ALGSKGAGEVPALAESVTQAQDQVNVIEAELGRYTLITPRAGIITAVGATPGQVVTPDTAVATMASTTLEVTAPLTQSDLTAVAVAVRASIARAHRHPRR
ncbi:MAG: HlyD family efflux transporter periplasmic adaptor subunit, partial [Firmicutes bacterium]|nr:HlyD family efflux transporter periplasmic adaptor subunit [Bacillota bacterium]